MQARNSKLGIAVRCALKSFNRHHFVRLPRLLRSFHHRSQPPLQDACGTVLVVVAMAGDELEPDAPVSSGLFHGSLSSLCGGGALPGTAVEATEGAVVPVVVVAEPVLRAAAAAPGCVPVVCKSKGARRH